jgi:hypothetical protein
MRQQKTSATAGEQQLLTSCTVMFLLRAVLATSDLGRSSLALTPGGCVVTLFCSHQEREGYTLIQRA